MSKSSPERNKAIVLEAFETLFNKRDYAAAERFWSPNYIQHSAHIAPGREGLFNVVRSVPATMHYENQFIVVKSIGTFCRTRRPRPNLSAAFQCLVTHSPSDRRKNANRPNNFRRAV